jgi:hypothetical protein
VTGKKPEAQLTPSSSHSPEQRLLLANVKKFGPNGDVVQATNTQPGMHTPAMHAGQQTQAQQPWIILKSHRGGDGGATSKSMMMPLICSGD